MNTIDQITNFLGWCTVINVCILLFSTISLIIGRKFVTKIHERIFNLSEQKLSSLYFRYLAYYKIGIIIFNLVPYFSLKIIGWYEIEVPIEYEGRTSQRKNKGNARIFLVRGNRRAHPLHVWNSKSNRFSWFRKEFIYRSSSTKN